MKRSYWWLPGKSFPLPSSLNNPGVTKIYLHNANTGHNCGSNGFEYTCHGTWLFSPPWLPLLRGKKNNNESPSQPTWFICQEFTFSLLAIRFHSKVRYVWAKMCSSLCPLLIIRQSLSYTANDIAFLPSSSDTPFVFFCLTDVLFSPPP